MRHSRLHSPPNSDRNLHTWVDLLHTAPTKELLVLLSAEQALQTSSATGLATTLDEADIWALLFSQDICMSEEQLLHLVTQWCKAHASAQFLQMMMHIDFGHLNHVQVLQHKCFLHSFEAVHVPLQSFPVSAHSPNYPVQSTCIEGLPQ